MKRYTNEQIRAFYNIPPLWYAKRQVEDFYKIPEGYQQPWEKEGWSGLSYSFSTAVLYDQILKNLKKARGEEEIVEYTYEGKSIRELKYYELLVARDKIQSAWAKRPGSWVGLTEQELLDAITKEIQRRKQSDSLEPKLTMEQKVERENKALQERIRVLEREQHERKVEQHRQAVAKHNADYTAFVTKIYKAIPWWRRRKIADTSGDLYYDMSGFTTRRRELEEWEAALQAEGSKHGIRPFYRTHRIK